MQELFYTTCDAAEDCCQVQKVIVPWNGVGQSTAGKNIPIEVSQKKARLVNIFQQKVTSVVGCL